MNLQRVATCLYVISKEAKKIRDERKLIKLYLFEYDVNEFAIEINDEPVRADTIEHLVTTYYREFWDIDDQLRRKEDALEEADDPEEKRRLQKEFEAVKLELEIADENYKEAHRALGRLQELHELLHEKRRYMEEIYALKNRVLTLLNPPTSCYHRFPAGDIRPMYELEGFRFHGTELDEGTTVEFADIEEISAEKKRDVEITFAEAVEYLRHIEMSGSINSKEEDRK